MRILMVSSFYPPFHVGGACTHVYYLANHLARLGHYVDVVFSSDCYRLVRKRVNATRKAEDYPNDPKVRTYDIAGLPGRVTPLFSYTVGHVPVRLKEILRRRYDLIHYHNIAMFSAKVFKYGDAPKIFTAHDHWLFCPLNDRYRDGEPCPEQDGCTRCLIRHGRPPQLWRHFVSDMTGYLDAVITPSEYMKAFLLENGVDAPIHVIPNFVVPPPSWKRDPEGKGASTMHEGKGYFLYAGMLERFKGVMDVLRASQEIDEKFLIAGDGSIAGEVRRAEKELPNVKYLGWLGMSSLFRYYANAKALLVPSRCNENFPSSILEALSVGTPSIGTNRGGIPEILDSVDPELIMKGSLTEAIRSFKGGYDRGTLIDVYRRRFTPDVYAQAYASLLQSLPGTLRRT